MMIKEKKTIRVSGVRPMTDYKLWVRFNTGEALFREVCIDYGMSVYESRWFACSRFLSVPQAQIFLSSL